MPPLKHHLLCSGSLLLQDFFVLFRQPCMGAKSVKMIKDAEKTIEIKQNKALSDMQSQSAELAMAAAGKIVGGEGDAESAGAAMYDEFLNEVGDSGDTEGN